MKGLLTILIFCISMGTFAQNEWWNKNGKKKAKKEMAVNTKTPASAKITSLNNRQDSTDSIFHPKPGHVLVHKSSLVDAIIKFKSANIPPYTQPTMEGYRIQLFFDPEKRKVDSARAVILDMNHDVRTYVKYLAPNYYLFEGDYRTKLNAEKNRSDWLDDFPTAIVKQTRIYLPSLKVEDTATGDDASDKDK